MKYLRSISALLITALLISACTSKGKNSVSATTDPANETKRVTIPVRTMVLAKTKIARTIDYTATILPFEEVNMAPSTPGRIDKIYVEEGDRVNKGDKLFLMDRTQLYQLELQLSNLQKDLDRIAYEFDAVSSGSKIIITTEKDMVRFRDLGTVPEVMRKFMYYIPLKISFLNDMGQDFDRKIVNYVKENKCNVNLYSKSNRF